MFGRQVAPAVEESSGSRFVGKASSRVYYLSNATVPSRTANSIQVMKMCDALAEHFDEVVLFCRGSSTPAADAFRYYGVRPCFQIRGVPVPQVPVAGRALYELATLSRVLRGPRPTLLYGRDFYALALLALLPERRAPMVLETHQPPSNRFEHALQRRLFASPAFERLVVISEALRDEYLRRFARLPIERILVAHDGADPGEAAGEPEPGWDGELRGPSGSLRLGYVGSLAPGKGMELIAALAPKMPQHRFHVVGGSPSEVRQWRRRAPFENLVFHGHVDPEAVPGHLRGFDAMLAPYQERVLVGRKRVDVAAWMSPLKIFEYMAAGKPIVASDLPVLREVLEDGVNALLAAPGDRDAWMARIEALRDDASLRARIGSAARQDVLRRHTWRNRVAAIAGALGVS